MLGWGLMTMVLGAVNNFAGLVVVRFLLGAFEAGLFPGIIYCLTFWYKPDERALRAALILACATLGKTNFEFLCITALNTKPHRWSLWRCHCVRCGSHESRTQLASLALVVYH